MTRAEKEGSGTKHGLSVRAEAETARDGSCCRKKKKEKWTKRRPDLDVA